MNVGWRSSQVQASVVERSLVWGRSVSGLLRLGASGPPVRGGDEGPLFATASDVGTGSRRCNSS